MQTWQRIRTYDRVKFRHVIARADRAEDKRLTVAVISAEHTSQMYLSPPSVPRDMVFFLITPMVDLWKLQGVRSVSISHRIARVYLRYIKSNNKSQVIQVIQVDHRSIKRSAFETGSSLVGVLQYRLNSDL